MISWRFFPSIAAFMLIALGHAAWANDLCPEDGVGSYKVGSSIIQVEGAQVSGSGSTAFLDWILAPAFTHDFFDVDGDGIAYPNPFIDQLAFPFVPGTGDINTWWLLQYRAVGHRPALTEFLANQANNVIPTSIPADAGIINGFVYAANGQVQWAGPYGNASGTPVAPCEIGFALLNAPLAQSVALPGDPVWNNTPGSAGYGQNPITSSTEMVSLLQPLNPQGGDEGGYCCNSGLICISDSDCLADDACCPGAKLLNINVLSPDNGTIFDHLLTWEPMTFIGNRGLGKNEIWFTQAQHLWTTGRMPNGENLVTVTGDITSPERIGFMNSVGIDPSWGRGDNVGAPVGGTHFSQLGPDWQPTNHRSVSGVETAVAQNRLAVGYTDILGSGRALEDVLEGKYEILGTCKDVTASGQEACDCHLTGSIRPTGDLVIDNCDACSGWQLGRATSVATLGDINANRDPLDPLYAKEHPAVANQGIANLWNTQFDYISEIHSAFPCYCETTGECPIFCGSHTCTLGEECTYTIGDGIFLPETEFECGPCKRKRCSSDSDCPGSDTCSGQTSACFWSSLLPQPWFWSRSLACVADFAEPSSFIPNNNIPDLQDWGREFAAFQTPPFGVASIAGLAPTRAMMTKCTYSDGSTDGNYCQKVGSSFVPLAAGSYLSGRNAVQGDFNGDGLRDLNDAAELVSAYYTPRAWQQSAVAQGAGVAGEMLEDVAVPEILGDFNGDGSLTKEDLRYFADGLAMVPDGMGGIRLDRKQGAVAIDNAISALGQPFPWADSSPQLLNPPASPCGEQTFSTPAPISTLLVTGKPYVAGDFRGDVAGGSPTAGAQPLGWDGRVDTADVDYVCRNIGDWTNLDEAVYMDLSADINGDTRVTHDDVVELVEQILGMPLADLNLDGLVNDLDRAVAQATIDAGSAGCNGDESCAWSDGDINCDGAVDALDLEGWLQCIPTPIGDGCFNGLCPTHPCFECIDGGYVEDPACCVDEACLEFPPNHPVSIKQCGDCFGFCNEGGYCDSLAPGCSLDPDFVGCRPSNALESIYLCGDCFGECLNGFYCDAQDRPECWLVPGDQGCYPPGSAVADLLCPEPESIATECVPECAWLLDDTYRVVQCNCTTLGDCAIEIPPDGQKPYCHGTCDSGAPCTMIELGHPHQGKEPIICCACPDHCAPLPDASGCRQVDCPAGKCFGECVDGGYCDSIDCPIFDECPSCYAANDLISIHMCSDCFGECLGGSYCDNISGPPNCCIGQACECYDRNELESVLLCRNTLGSCFGSCVLGSYVNPFSDPDCWLGGQAAYSPDHLYSQVLCNQTGTVDTHCHAECAVLDPVDDTFLISECECTNSVCEIKINKNGLPYCQSNDVDVTCHLDFTLDGETGDTLACCDPQCFTAQPLLPDHRFNLSGFILACATDADCTAMGGESVCREGACYVPRQRFLSVRPNPANDGINRAYRVSLSDGKGGSMVLGFVGMPEDVDTVGPGPSLFHISRIEGVPAYMQWETLPSGYLTIGDCDVSPGHTYIIQAIAEGEDPVDEANYSLPLPLPTASTFGDVTGGGNPGSPPDGTANLVDVQALVLGFQQVQSVPKDWLAIENTSGVAQPDLNITLADVFASVIGFQAGTYPGPAPLECP